MASSTDIHEEEDEREKKQEAKLAEILAELKLAASELDLQQTLIFFLLAALAWLVPAAAPLTFLTWLAWKLKQHWPSSKAAQEEEDGKKHGACKKHGA